MSDMVVTLSGVVGIQDMEGKTAEQLVNVALANWNIPKESVDGPFVSVLNRASGKHRPLQGQETIGGLNPEEDTVRVVLPLKTVSIEQEDSRQYLVE